jgi:hypothetical protein
LVSALFERPNHANKHLPAIDPFPVDPSAVGLQNVDHTIHGKLLLELHKSREHCVVGHAAQFNELLLEFLENGGRALLLSSAALTRSR